MTRAPVSRARPLVVTRFLRLPSRAPAGPLRQPGRFHLSARCVSTSTARRRHPVTCLSTPQPRRAVGTNPERPGVAWATSRSNCCASGMRQERPTTTSSGTSSHRAARRLPIEPSGPPLNSDRRGRSRRGDGRTAGGRSMQGVDASQCHPGLCNAARGLARRLSTGQLSSSRFTFRLWLRC